MPGREAVMPAGLDVQQLVERVAVGQPGGPLLVGREEVAEAVERQRDREADARGDDLALLEVGGDLLDRAVLVLQVVGRPARRVDAIGVGEVGRPEPEVDVAGPVEGDSQGVDAVRQLLPPAGDDDLPVGLAVAVDVDDERELALGGDEHAFAQGVTGGRQCHADRGDEAPLVLPEALDPVLQAVAVGVGEQVDISAIGQGDELAVAAVLDVVDIRQVDRQLSRREARHEHLHGRRVRDGDQRLADAGPVGPVAADRSLAAESGREIALDLPALGLVEHAVVDQDLEDVAVEEAADVRGEAVVAGPHGDPVDVEDRRGSVARAARSNRRQYSFVPPGPGVEVTVIRRTTPKSEGVAIRLFAPTKPFPSTFSASKRPV